MRAKREIKITSDTYRMLGILCLVLSLLFFIAVLVGSIVNRSSGPERFLNKYEKICKAGDVEKYHKLYDKELIKSGAVDGLQIPFEGYAPEYIFESVEDTGDKQFILTYTVSYDLIQNKNVDGVEKEVKVPFSYPGNKLTLRKKFLGYKLISVENAAN